MHRKNMKVNQWEDLASWLASEGLDCYAELIWGAPGETPESLLAGCDRLASKVSRIAVYPLLLLPNTGLTRSALIMGLMEWFESFSASEVRAFCDAIPVIAESPAIARSLRMLYSQPGLEQEFEDWWGAAIVPQFPAPWRSFAADLYTYERWTRPVYADPHEALHPGWYADDVTPGDVSYFTDPIRFSYDMAWLQPGEANLEEPPQPEEVWYVFCARAGFYDHMDNHEVAAHDQARPTLVKPEVTAGTKEDLWAQL